ncbi:hypothetical protein KP509_10G079600 [Ceratopteris richardii]|uniref:Retrotransposon gag domain-containing protein n=1 Tax=Ceratopteris richardii TaxID=49495 RepID=A0A8T2TWT0_CERRI|nr:hypothetical protein KP509_10G079600 [Ceratopteris richardii]
MAQRHATPLGDFPCFLGSSDEDPDAHIQLFEPICGAHEIVDDGRKLWIFPATLRGDAIEWYANLGVHERTSYDDLKTNFLRKFRGLGFEEKLAEELDHLRQRATESIDKYIDRMDTIVRKLGNGAPDKETLKRRFLVGLHDEKVEQYIRLKRPVSLEEAKHEARIWEEAQCVLQMHRERLISHSRSLGTNQESTMFVDINPKKEVELLDKLNADTLARVKPSCSPIGHMAMECLSVQESRSDSPRIRHDGIRERKTNEYTTKVRESRRGDISMSPCLSGNFGKAEVFDERRAQVESKPRTKIIVNQGVPEVGVVPPVQTMRSEGKTSEDERCKRQEPILARERDRHKNDVILMPKIVDAVECDLQEDVGLQCKVQQLEHDVEKLRDVVSHLESELAQEKKSRIQQEEKVKEIGRVTYEWLKEAQDIRDNENKRIDQLVQENEGFRELIKRWEFDRKIQREKIVSETEKCEELERKVEALIERLQTFERTKIVRRTSKGKEERLGSRQVDSKECRVNNESRFREEVNGDRVCGSQKRKGDGIATRKRTTTKVESSKVSMTTPITKRILKKSETRDFGKRCKGTLSDGREKRKGNSTTHAQEINHMERKCVRKSDKEIEGRDSFTTYQHIMKEDKFVARVNAFYEEIERECKGVAKCEQKFHDLHDVASELEKKTFGTMWLCRMKPCFEKDKHFEEDEHL